MKSIDLWNKLVSEGETVVDEKFIKPSKTITIKKQSPLTFKLREFRVESLEKMENGNVKIHLEKEQFYARFNQGVVTINLPYIALLSANEVLNKENKVKLEEVFTTNKKVLKRFWYNLDVYLEICHKALQFRHRRLLKTSSCVSPLHWNYGAIARLPKTETIDKLLFGGYSTISLGYAGLYECVVALIGKSHTSEEGKKLALEIMQLLNDRCTKWKEEENIGYSVYGTPLESTTYKFALALQRDFGKIKEVSEHNYITNSYHVCVREAIDPFEKLSMENDFQSLSQGGCISYIETANLQQNPEAVIEVMKFIYDNIMYAEINTKSDYCQVCGSTDEIKIVEGKDGKLVWECPNCGNRDQTKMNVARRTCGYIGSNFWNQGRTAEIKDRYVHLGNGEQEVCI